jgi:hypothetical protein
MRGVDLGPFILNFNLGEPTMAALELLIEESKKWVTKIKAN